VVELDPKDAAAFLDLLEPLASNKPVTPLKNELEVVLEGDLTQTLVDPGDYEGDHTGMIRLTGDEVEEVEEEVEEEVKKKPRKRKAKAE
jgi:hypothetical protein